jgi:hypothetical protein
MENFKLIAPKALEVPTQYSMRQTNNRQAMAKRISVSPEDVLKLNKPTKGFLCSISSNTHNIEFNKFVVRDDASQRVIFEVGDGVPMVGSMEVDCDNFDDSDCFRAIKYTFSADVLRLPVVSTR